ncbi:hypothetical protein D770_02630 [Flammeovirgaceae bacterium 311]|nr:hypothetical protein D770_02630 [Flammeovirgaceae bacterium 311]
MPQGFRGIQLLRREAESEVEFTTIMWFDSIETVKAFAGEQFEKAHIDPILQTLLTRYDTIAVHQQVRFSNFK